MSAIIETNRMILRPFQAEDIDDLYNYAKNPKVGPAAGWKPHHSKEESRIIMNEIFLEKDNIWAMTHKTDGRVFGSIGLMPDPKRQNDEAQMIGYSIAEEEWGNGLTTEAAQAVVKYGFEVLHLGLISAYCYPDNKRSARVMEKCGFLYEGTLLQSEKCFDGIIRDNKCYALTATKYRENSTSI
ncbi:MAG: GNAT family N-acetyltransferase [Paludibacteraceae bacterium]